MAHPQLQEATGSEASYIPFSLIPWLRDIEFHQTLPTCVTREGVQLRRKRSLYLYSVGIRCDSETSHSSRKGSSQRWLFLLHKPDDFFQPSALLPPLSVINCIKVMISTNIKRSRGTTCGIFPKLGWKTHRDGEWLELSHLLPEASAVDDESRIPFLPWWGGQDSGVPRIFYICEGFIVWLNESNPFPRDISVVSREQITNHSLTILCLSYSSSPVSLALLSVCVCVCVCVCVHARMQVHVCALMWICFCIKVRTEEEWQRCLYSRDSK